MNLAVCLFVIKQKARFIGKCKNMLFFPTSLGFLSQKKADLVDISSHG